MCKIQDSPMTTFAGQCSGMEEEGRSDTDSGLSSQLWGSGPGPGSGGQWLPVVSRSRSQPHHPEPESAATCAAWPWSHAALDTPDQHCDSEIRIKQYTDMSTAQPPKHVLKTKTLKDWEVYLMTWRWLSPQWCYWWRILSRLSPTY